MKMVLYTCPRCGYETQHKQNFRTHLNRKTLCPSTLSDTTKEDMITLLDEGHFKQEVYSCELCSMTFKTPQTKYSHKLRCRQKQSGGLPEDLQMRIEKLEHNIETMATMHNMNITNIANQNIVVLNNFGNETYDHISDDFLRDCLGNRFDGVKALIERIHFSEQATKNKNVRMKSIKHNQMEVANDQKWVVKDANETTDAMIRKSGTLLKQYYSRTEFPIDITEVDVDDLDVRIQMFLASFLKRSEQYYDLRRSIVNIIIEHSDEYKKKAS